MTKKLDIEKLESIPKKLWRKLTVREVKEQDPEEEQRDFDATDKLLGLLFIAILGVAGGGTFVYAMQVWSTPVPVDGTTVNIITTMPLYQDIGGTIALGTLHMGACEAGQTSSTAFFWIKNPNTVPIEITGYNITNWTPVTANTITVDVTGWETALVPGALREIDVSVTLPPGFSVPSWSFRINLQEQYPVVP
jgi:hypothetical protein